MNVAVAMTLVAAAGLLWLWWPALWDVPARHEHMAAMDELARVHLRCRVCGRSERYRVAGDPEQHAMRAGWMVDPDVCPDCRPGGDW